MHEKKEMECGNMPIIIMIITRVYSNSMSRAITYGLSLSLYRYNKLLFKIKNNTAQITIST